MLNIRRVSLGIVAEPAEPGYRDRTAILIATLDRVVTCSARHGYRDRSLVRTPNTRMAAINEVSDT